jgi:hypothetical protein
MENFVCHSKLRRGSSRQMENSVCGSKITERIMSADGK